MSNKYLIIPVLLEHLQAKTKIASWSIVATSNPLPHLNGASFCHSIRAPNTDVLRLGIQSWMFMCKTTENVFCTACFVISPGILWVETRVLHVCGFFSFRYKLRTEWSEIAWGKIKEVTSVWNGEPCSTMYIHRDDILNQNADLTFMR